MLARRISTALVLILAVAASAVAQETNPVIAGYFIQWGVYGRNYHVTNVPAHLITHINYAFANPIYDEENDRGYLQSYDTYADMEMVYPGDTGEQPLKGSFNQLNKLKQRYPHVRTLISIGGWTLSDHFSDIAASTNARHTFVESCIAFVTNYGFDGVDVDWEYPVEGGKDGLKHRPGDATNYVQLLQQMRDAFDAQGLEDGNTYLLTVATSAGYNTVTNRFRLAEMAAIVDWFNVMTYDLSGPWDGQTGHLAPLFPNPAALIPGLNAHTSISTYLSNGVPADKLVLGLPFYGRGFAGVSSQDNGLFQNCSGGTAEGSWEPSSFDFNDLSDGVRGHQYINNNGFTRYWDEIAMAPYLYNPATEVFISYEDEQSIKAKLDYVLGQGLRGIIYWSMDADTESLRLQLPLSTRLYPTQLRVEQENAIHVSWHALTDQTYSVDERPSLLEGDWQACSTTITGRGMRVEITNTTSDAMGFYRVQMTIPPMP